MIAAERVMPETIQFLGIGFRSESHLYWFQGSMSFAIASLVTLAYFLFGRPTRDTRQLAVIYWAITLLFHACAFVTASIYAYKRVYWWGQSPNGALFSLDCIWFNAMMSVVYVALIAIVRSIGRRRDAAEELDPGDPALIADD